MKNNIKVPSFKTKKIREDIFELVEHAPTREMYDTIMRAIDTSMDELVEIRSSITSNGNSKALKLWDDAFKNFGEREAFYYQAFVEGEDRSVVDAPLFEGNYKGFDFDKKPKWPDIETPWRLANELSTIMAASGATKEDFSNLEERFRYVISTFWSEANSLISSQKEKYESMMEEGEKGEGVPRVYGFWPIVLVGAGVAAVVGALGAAAGYSAGKGKTPEDYIQSTSLEKHMQTAKTIGVGIAIGVVLALLFILRVRR